MEAQTKAIIITVVIVIFFFILIVYKIKSDKKRKSHTFSFTEQRKNNNIKNEQQIPKPLAKKGFLAGTPSWGLALITLVILFSVFKTIIDQYTKNGELDNTGIVALIIYCLILIINCFLIVKKNPKSIWYVPIICNTLTIAMALSDNFWTTELWKFLGGGFVLSIIASIFGAIFGKMTVVPDNKQNTNE